MAARLRAPRLFCQVLAACVLAWVALAPAGARAEIYRWVDSQGREHFTTDLRQVPSVYREAARTRAASRPALIQEDAPPAARDPSPHAAPSAGAAAGPRPGAWQVEDPKPQGRGEAHWRSEHGRRVARVEQLERRVAELEALGAESAPSRRGRISDRNFDRYHGRHLEWEGKTQELVRARAELEAFRETARRAGVPPGWLR